MIARPRLNTHARTVTDLVSDDFNRADLGSNWTQNTGTSGTVSSTSWGIITSGNIAVASWAGSTTPAVDQYAEATIAPGWSAASSKLLLGLNVRRRSADSARYMLSYDNDTGDAEPAVQWIMKYDGVAPESTRLILTNAVLGAPVAGDRLRVEVRGSGATVSLIGFLNGTVIFEGTDTHADRINTVGPPGLVARVFVGETISYPQACFTDFAAGTLL